MNFPDYIQSTITAEIIQNELEQSFIYFKTLEPGLKKRFVERVYVFVKQKRFVGRQNLQITDAIRIIISACAVQVTFGLDTFTLDTFEYVVIYPDVYESPVTKKMHKGETNLHGFICLSWKHVLAGIKNPADNYNLGIHEWTHALRFNGINYERTDYFFDGYINKWVACAMPQYTALKKGNLSIFRRYGAANINEFLSVCTEHFFESPDEFKSKAPKFFEQMCILLNQVPGVNTSAKIDVRNTLIFATDTVHKEETPVLVLEDSFFRTLFNMGVGLFYFGLALTLLLFQNNTTTNILRSNFMKTMFICKAVSYRYLQKYSASITAL